METPDIVWATPLYEFLRQCSAAPLLRRVLDCGAGGSDSPVQLFHQYGYRTCGIDIQAEAVRRAACFCRDNGVPLGIFLGDMRSIPFASESFGAVFSFNAIWFMTKPDTARAVREMERGLRPGGLCYVNFVSADDPNRRPFADDAYARRLLSSEQFADHEDDEAESYFHDLVILRKEKRWMDKVHGGGRLLQVYTDYIARKGD